MQRSGPFVVGDRVQLTDTKGRKYTVVLVEGAEFFTHHGAVRHDDLIGAPEGSIVTSTNPCSLTDSRPTFVSPVTSSSPRGPTSTVTMPVRSSSESVAPETTSLPASIITT